MAKIADGVLKNWKDGDVVTGADYNQEREMMRIAINDNDTKIKANTTEINSLTVEQRGLYDYVQNVEGEKASKWETYTKADVNSLLTTKMDKDLVYTKSELDSTARNHRGLWQGMSPSSFLSSATDLTKFVKEEVRGSNENGEYIRFSNGLQICWREHVIPSISPAAITSAQTGSSTYYYYPSTWTFPVPFNWSPVVNISGDINITGIKQIGVKRATYQNAEIEMGALAYFANVSVWRYLFAIGYWK